MQHLDLLSRIAFFLLYSIVVVSFSLVLFFLLNSTVATLAVSLCCLVLLLLGLHIAIFGGTGDNKVRLSIASCSTLILFGALQLKSTALSLARPFLEKIATQLGIPFTNTTFEVSGNADSWLAALIVVSWVVVCYFLLRNLGTSPMGRPSEERLSDILAEPTTKERIRSLKANLRNKLDIINAQTRWSEANYVPLEAEVQIVEGRAAKRRVVDLQNAIRLNPKAGLFVVLGEPGTGKSVALRKLASDLLTSSGPNDRIPVYVNLKEWRSEHVWTPGNKPSLQEFHSFVLQNILQEIDLPSQVFLKKNYEILLEKGFFFFIFDSFDEIPAVLDHDEESWIIDELSNCISSYVINSRGVIASRLFRQPRLNHRERTVLEIQPFSDDRIIQAIRIASNEPDKLVRIVLSERSDLGAIARNPFLLHLVIFHFNETNSAPSSQAEMFQTFIDASIESARRALGMQDKSKEELYAACENISRIMFARPQGGLEISESELRQHLNSGSLDTVLRFLVSARIGRVGPVSGAFSFSHRRFNEYFLVRQLSSKRAEVPFNAIQTDARWRDALVLYAEIADESDAKALAAHAWSYAENLRTITLGSDRTDFLQARSALRFIVEGFRNRPEIVGPFRNALDQLIRSKLSHHATDLIETKTSLEGLGLLDSERAAQIIMIVLSDYKGWISEQAAVAARYLPTISHDLALLIYKHCTRRPALEGFFKARLQLNLLSLSGAFSEVTRMLKWFVADVLKIGICSALILIVMGVTLDYHVATSVLLGIAVMLFTTAPVALLREGQSYFRDYPTLIRLVALASLGSLAGNFVPKLGNPRLRPEDLNLPQFLEIREATANGPIVTTIILLVILVVPITSTFWTFETLKNLWSKRVVIQLLFILSGFVVPIALAFLFAEQFEFYLKLIAPYVFYVTLSMILLLFLAGVLPQSVNWLRDKLAIALMTKNFRPDRREIAENFLKLRSSRGRLGYVAELERLSFGRSKAFQDRENVWPNGTRPQLHDLASTRLAQLDARWLGVD